MKRLSLFSQILAINALLVTATVFVAAVAVDLSVSDAGRRREFAVLVLALLVSLLANALLLRRRLRPLERLIRSMEEADLTSGSGRAHASRADADEVVRLQAAFDRVKRHVERDGDFGQPLDRGALAFRHFDVDAVRPEGTAEIGFDPGVVGRLHSARPCKRITNT